MTMSNADENPAERPQPVRTFKMNGLRRTSDRAIGALIRLGVVPGSYLLTTRGRKTGQLRTTPVTLVESDGHRWLVAPFGPVPWVLNARSAGRVTLRRGRHSEELAIREVTAEEAGPVLKRYIAVAGVTRPYFRAGKDDPVEDFVAEAGLHPVFELLPVSPD
jgi:deazaflavin-dependent oxidoreductase (nitroreductase family)